VFTIKIIFTLLLILLSGAFGRMGGAANSGQWYGGILNTNWRDIGCALVLLLVTILWAGWHQDLVWCYVAAGVLTFASFRTYWDWLFGYDNLWFSGLCVGVAGLPLMWVSGDGWWLFPARIVILALVWGILNKYLPQKGILVWRRDVAEENLRYMASL
jgi:hypothetical protein